MTQITNPRITLVVKRTQYQEIVIDEYQGYSMPKTLTGLFELCEDVKAYSSSHAVDENWTDGEYEIDSFNVGINGEDQ